MGIFDIISNRRKVVAQHSEPNDVYDIGVTDVDTNTNKESVDWGTKLPDLVRPTIPNLRKCAEKSNFVNGILEDLIIKSISGWVIKGTDESAVELIKEMDKEWNLNTMYHDIVRNCAVDGITFYDSVAVENKLTFRELAFDGDNYRMKELYDDTGRNIIGYKQLVKINQNTNKGWVHKKFAELTEQKEVMEFNFPKENILAPCLFRRKGKPHSLVRNVIDKAYMVELLSEMMVQVVYKQSNTMALKIGNKDSRNVNLTDEDKKKFAKMASDYHRHGVLILPFGVDADMVGEFVLPKIQEYIANLEHQIFVGLWTPEAVYSSSSSNRSTAVVQLDSDKSGRVLVQEYIQEYLARFTQLKIINPQLKLFNKEEDSVWIEFNPIDNSGLYNEEGEEENPKPVVDEDNINVKPTDGMNLNNIRDAEGRVNG